MNCLDKYSPATSDMYKPLHKLSSLKTGISIEQDIPELYKRVKVLIKKDACIKFYDEKKCLYIRMQPWSWHIMSKKRYILPSGLSTKQCNPMVNSIC